MPWSSTRPRNLALASASEQQPDLGLVASHDAVVRRTCPLAWIKKAPMTAASTRLPMRGLRDDSSSLVTAMAGPWVDLHREDETRYPLPTYSARPKLEA